MFRLAILLICLACPARADSAYPVVACRGPHLATISQHDRTPEALMRLYPALGQAPPAARAVLVEDGVARWTEATRSTLGARCLAADDAMRAPHPGQWDLVGPVFETGTCGTVKVTAPLRGFPRHVPFGTTFHPDAVLGRDPAGWQVLRDPDNFIWYAFTMPPSALPALTGISYTFLPGGPDLVVIEGTFQTTGGCADEFSLSLIRTGE